MWLMRIRCGLVLLAALALAACGQAPPTTPATPTATMSLLPTPVVAQRHDCGNLSADMCEQVIAQVIRQVPEMAGSPIAVAATLDPDQLTRRGGDLTVLVAFAPFDLSDYWFSPPTWTVTQRMMLAADWHVERWRGGSLPPHFVTLLRAAQIDA